MTNQPTERITRSEMRDALLRSGYLLEFRVESHLRDLSWGYIQANATYPDPESGKSREFDLYAMNAHKAGPAESDYLFGVLLIECINNPQPLVILTKEPQVRTLHHYEIKVAGLPNKIPDQGRKDGWQLLSEFLAMKDYHHYCKGRVGTQFCSFAKKKSGRIDQWMALHEGSHYDSFQKLCDATDYFVERAETRTFNLISQLNVLIYYPVIILQGDLVEARETKRSVAFCSADHLQFRRSAARKNKPSTYQIDVIRERYFPKYLDLIVKELQRSAGLLHRHHKAVRSAIDLIVKQA
jgi:hypothetical protein